MKKKNFTPDQIKSSFTFVSETFSDWKFDKDIPPRLGLIIKEFMEKANFVMAAIDNDEPASHIREMVIEAEQAADTARRAVESSTEIPKEVRDQVIAVHDLIHELKEKARAS